MKGFPAVRPKDQSAGTFSKVNERKADRQLALACLTENRIYPFVSYEEASPDHVSFDTVTGSGHNYIIGNHFRFLLSYLIVPFTDTPSTPSSEWDRYETYSVISTINWKTRKTLFDLSEIAQAFTDKPIGDGKNELKVHCYSQLNLPARFPLTEEDELGVKQVDRLCESLSIPLLGSLTKLWLLQWASGMMLSSPLEVGAVATVSEENSLCSESISLDSEFARDQEEFLDNIPKRKHLPEGGFTSKVWRKTGVITYDLPEFLLLNMLVKKLFTKIAEIIRTPRSCFSKRQYRYTVHMIINNFNPRGFAYQGPWLKMQVGSYPSSCYRYNRDLQILKAGRSTEKEKLKCKAYSHT